MCYPPLKWALKLKRIAQCYICKLKFNGVTPAEHNGYPKWRKHYYSDEYDTHIAFVY